jgi:hypothetical protein
MRTILVFCAICFTLGSCVAVKGYDMVYVNDSEMELSKKKCERFETLAHLYREGAAGANGGKTGGGCGCN